MNNLIILVGTISSIDLSSNSFVLKVSRPFKNKEGEIEDDLFICKTWKGMYSYLSSYINLEDTILIKGKLINEKEKFIIKVEEFSLIRRAQKKISA